eukprot:TCALIF_08830-PA protein Name:"Protein of unknown function" AED:0.00 eAED:0.00 QI:162/1/1/1/0.5/0.28/7/363/66
MTVAEAAAPSPVATLDPLDAMEPVLPVQNVPQKEDRQPETVHQDLAFVAYFLCPTPGIPSRRTALT